MLHGQVAVGDTFCVSLSMSSGAHAPCTPSPMLLRTVGLVHPDDAAEQISHVQAMVAPQHADGGSPLLQDVDAMREQMCRSITPILLRPPSRVGGNQARNPRKK